MQPLRAFTSLPLLFGLALTSGYAVSQRPTQGVGDSGSRGVTQSDVLLTGALEQTMPADGASGVSLDRNTSLFFTAPLDPASVTASSIMAAAGATTLPTELSLSANRRVVTIEYPFFLPENATVSVTIDGDQLRSNLGRPIDADADGQIGGVGVIQFQTGPGTPAPMTTAAATILGRVVDPAGNPLAGATVEAWSSPRTEGAPPLPGPPAVSDAGGAFQLQTVTFTARETFLIAIGMPGRTEALRRVEVLAGRTRRVAEATLQTLETPTAVTAAAGATLQDPTGAATLIIPPGALSADSSIGVTVLSSEALPDALPPLVAEQGFFVEVSGVVGEPTDLPVTLQIPNTHGLPDGTRIPFGRIDDNTLQWTDLRDLYTGPPPVPDELLGTVRTGGPLGTYLEVQLDRFSSIGTGYGLPLALPITTDNSGGIAGGERSGGAGRPPEVCLLPPGPGEAMDPNVTGGLAPEGSPGVVHGEATIGLREGYLWETIDLPTMREFTEEFGISLGYFSGAANPSLTLAAQVDHGARAVDVTAFAFEIEGFVAKAFYGPSSAAQKPIGTFLWPGVDGLGQTLPTGSYPFSIEVTSLNSGVAVSLPPSFSQATSTSFGGVEYPGLTPLRGSLAGRSVLVNLEDSPYGAGWSLLEEQRIHPDPDGHIVLLQGNGDWRLFAPDPSAQNVYLSPPGEFSTLIFNPQNGGFVRSYPDGRKVVFDSLGRIESITDRFGNPTTFSYTGGLLTTIDSPTGYQLVMVYDPSGKLQRIEDSAQRGTDFVVDAAGDLVSATDASGLTRQFQYDPDHLLTQHTGPRGEQSVYLWSRGRAVQSEDYDTDGATLLRRRTFAPSALGGSVGAGSPTQGTIIEPIPMVEDRVDVFTDGRGVASAHATDARGNTILRRDGLDRVTAYAYGGGPIVSRTRPDGSVTTYEYDAVGNLTATRELSDPLTEYSVATREYDGPSGEISRAVDAEGMETRFSYDELGRLAAVRDHNGSQYQLLYQDPTFGHLPSRITSPTGEKVNLTYDAHGNIATLKDFPNPFREPDGRTFSFTYDAVGNITAATDRSGETTSYTYDEKNRVTSIRDGLLPMTSFDYGTSGDGCVSLVTLAGGPTISFEYDGLGRRIERRDQFGNSSHFTYDAEGNLVAYLDRNGDSIAYTYDRAGQLEKKQLPGNDLTFYERDVMGRLITAANPDCILVSSYDFLGRIVEATSLLDLTVEAGTELPVAHVSTYSFDRVGNRSTMTDDTGLVDLTYAYDNLHRLTGITDTAIPGGSWTLGYDTAGRRRHIVLPNGVTSVYAYDLVGQLALIGHTTSPPITLGYSQRDEDENLLVEARQGGVRSFTMALSYDALSQVDAASFSLIFGETEVDRNYSHDIADRLLDDEDFAYTYDLEGRLVARVHKGTDVTDRFEYDADGRLRRHAQEVDVLGSPQDVLVVTHDYDPLGRRYRKTVNGVVTKYVYDGVDILHELDGQNRIVRTLTHGPREHEPLAMRDMVTGQTLFYHADRLGSALAVSDTFGSLIQEYEYDEYGNQLDSAGPTVSSVLSYAGRELELDSGLYYARSRFYDPMTGRFLTQDPNGLRGDLNLYRYVGNNPTNRVAQTDHAAAIDVALRATEVARRLGVPAVRIPR